MEKDMSDTRIRDTFDEEALAALPQAPAFVSTLRARAFEEYRGMPMPSPETEE
jgi:hypothetical protein